MRVSISVGHRGVAAVRKPGTEHGLSLFSMKVLVCSAWAINAPSSSNLDSLNPLIYNYPALGCSLKTIFGHYAHWCD